MVYNYLCRCSDGDVCHADAQMMNDMKYKSEGGLYTSQAVKTYLRFPAPAGDWLAHQAEAVHAKTVYLGSCATCVYHIATQTITAKGAFPPFVTKAGNAPFIIKVRINISRKKVGKHLCNKTWKHMKDIKYV